MPEIRLQKTVLVAASPARILSCLQDPLFWSVLPTTFRKMDFVNRPLAIGGGLKPGFEAYRLADVTRDSVSFASDKLNLRFTAQPADSASAQLTLDITVLKPDCASKPLLESVDKDLLAIVELLDKTPWFAWLPEIRLQVQSEPKGFKMHSTIHIDLPYEAAAVEDVLVRRPLEFRNWIDADIEAHSGTVDVDASWPSQGSTVRYRYPRGFWFVPPFGRFNVGSIRLVDWSPCKGVVLSDKTEPGGVLSTWTFEFEKTPEGTALRLRKTISVTALSPRILYGGIMRYVEPMDTPRSVCCFVGVLARLYPTRQRETENVGVTD